MESLDYRYHRISLNDFDAEPEPDGRVRIVVAARDPGHPATEDLEDAVVHRAVEAHQGAVLVDRADEGGAEFQIFLPGSRPKNMEATS